MDTTFNNPALAEKSRVIVFEDSHFDYFFSQANEKNEYSLSFDVKEGRNVDINIIDFSPSKLTLNLEVNLPFSSHANIQVASVCFDSGDKVVSVNVNHLGEKSFSRTTMAGINVGSQSMKFLGSSFIKNGAHGSDTRQEGKITNLSENAKSEVSPSLLIKENDVKASHGAALGAYNPDILYYLMSRGLSEGESKKLITYGNLLPIIESLGNKELVEQAKEVLRGIAL